MSTASRSDYKFTCKDRISVVIFNEYISRRCNLCQICFNYMFDISVMLKWSGIFHDIYIVFLCFHKWKKWSILLSRGWRWISKNNSLNYFFKCKKRPFSYRLFLYLETLKNYISIVNCYYYCYGENPILHHFLKLRSLGE